MGCGKIYPAMEYCYNFVISLTTVKSEVLYQSRKIQNFVMERYSPQQRAKIVKLYFENFSSIISTQRAFRRAYPDRRAPHGETIRRLANAFLQNGSVIDVKHTGRPRSGRSNENIELVRADVQAEPKTSTRRRAAQLGLSERTLRRILHLDLHMYPYKIQTVFKLRPIDIQRRLQYAQIVTNLVEAEPNFWQNLIMSDEANFCLSGRVNKQNDRFWGTENPRFIQENVQFDQKVVVWCAICSERIIGPFFFEDARGNAVTVNGERYRTMIREFLQPQLEELGVENFWFQQDGATCHTARETVALLRDIFPARLLSKNGDIEWPPHSPDLTAPDFFLWGYLKNKVYINRPQTLEDLKANIREEFGQIPAEILRKVMLHAQSRVGHCLACRGGHLLDVVFHK